jgi:type III secretory pathway component EscT
MRIKKLFVGIMMGLALATPLMAAAPASALFDSSKDSACRGLALTDSNGCKAKSGALTLNGILKNIVNLLSILVGIVSVIMIIVGGFKYITSGGDSSNVQSAKNTIIYAVAGLVVVAISQGLVKFVLNKIGK